MQFDTPMQNYDAQAGDIGTKAASQLAQGADEVYARLRDDDKKDSIKESNEKTKPEDVAGFINPAVPMLIPPQNNAADITAIDQGKNQGVRQAGATGSGAASGTAYSTQLNDAVEGTMRSVLDNWQAATAKFVASSKASNIQEENNYQNKVSERWAQDVYQLGTAQAPHSTVVSAIMGAGLTGVMAGHKIDPTDPQHISFSLNQDGIQAATPMIPSDMRAELGLLGALLMTPAQYQATALTIGKTNKTSQQPVDQQFARNYGARVVKMVNDQGFNSWLKTIIQAKAPGNGQLSQQQMGEWTANFKLGMLMSAYAMSYKAAYGGVTGAEVAGQVKNLDLAKAGGDAPLMDAIRQQLQSMPPAQQTAALSRITNWLNRPETTQKIDSLMDPMKVFQGISGPGDGVQERKATDQPV